MMKIDLNPRPAVLRQFAWFALLGLPAIAWLVLRLAGAFSWSHWSLWAAAGIAVLQLGAFLAGAAGPTRWLFVGLTVIALPIGFVLSQILMAVVFYLVVTPIGLVFRTMGRDVLGRRPAPNQASFWHDRGPQRPRTSYFKLY